MIRALACIALVTATAIAHADSSKLEAARQAVESVAYDEASTLLTAALEEGGNSPVALTEIYRLTATTSIVIGDHERAQAAYRAWVALDPKASEPSTAAKFQDPFIAAQAYVKAKGPLAVKIGKTDNHQLVISITSDALGMAVSASLDPNDPGSRRPFGRQRQIVMKVPPGKAAVRVFVFDKFGNQLVARTFATFSVIPPQAAVVTPFYRSWLTWTISTVIIGSAGYYFRRQADQAQDELVAIAGSSGEHFFSEVKELEDKRDRNRSMSTGLFVGAGLCAATAVVMYVLRPRATKVVPTAERGPGIAILGQF